MNYVVAGYSIVLGILFLYAVWLLLRRRRLVDLAAVVAGRPGDRDGPGAGSGAAGDDP